MNVLDSILVSTIAAKRNGPFFDFRRKSTVDFQWNIIKMSRLFKMTQKSTKTKIIQRIKSRTRPDTKIKLVENQNLSSS